ncbi:TPA: virulence factor SrfB [Enterobacter kobei]|nr:virulence factor SrfB [Enterobacter kobei]
MMVNLTDVQNGITLIQNSGIQLVDAGISLALSNPHAGRFARQTANGPLLRLNYHAASGKYSLPEQDAGSAEIVKPESQFSFETSLAFLQGEWLPLLRLNAQHTQLIGPYNWARIQVNRLTAADLAGNDVHITLAFDTRTAAEEADMSSLAPTCADVRNGTRFCLAWQNHELAEFLDQTWVEGWLREMFIARAEQNGYREQDVATALKFFEYQAHYLNLLEIIAEQLPALQIQIVSETLSSPAIGVDLILDVGNSHTAGIMIEDHGTANDGLRQCAELQIRSLSEPHQPNDTLFTSRIEFSEARFGKPCYSTESGRDDAFIWPSLVRTGGEAKALAMRRTGSEGASGISSPRRYLWDTDPTAIPWRFSQPRGPNQHEALATAMPLMGLLNNEGALLSALPEEEQLPVFSPHYSRSSLMTFMLSELLAQALMQMNSVASRLRMGQVNAPRQLRNIILTLPSALPVQERELFRQRTEDAVALIWQTMGWQAQDENRSHAEEKKQNAIPRPAIHIDWDEATCAQLVWLYNETQLNYGGHVDLLFRNLVRPDRQPEEETVGRALRIASIDIGGGTTDMAIVQYARDDGRGKNIKITPQLLFREGFKIAGDDILHDIIQRIILPAIETQLCKSGVSDSSGMMSHLFGESTQADSHSVLRQQTTLQLLIPLGQAVLEYWRTSGTLNGNPHVLEISFAALLTAPPGEHVLNAIHQAVARADSAAGARFNVMETLLYVDFAMLNEALLSGAFAITAPLRALCQAIEHYHCDLLLIAGRPASLPAIQTLLRRSQPVPASRIICLNDYTVDVDCPLTLQGRLVNAKSTAAIGAMLYRLASGLRLPGFNFKAAEIQSWSTIRYLGILSDDNLLSDENIWYHDIDMNDPLYSLSPTLCFPLRGNIRLGFRQLANTHWPASPLYQLKITDPDLARHIAGDGELFVRLQLDPQTGVFSLAAAQLQDGTAVPVVKLALTLNTLCGKGNDNDQYWIDSGKLFKK